MCEISGQYCTTGTLGALLETCLEDREKEVDELNEDSDPLISLEDDPAPELFPSPLVLPAEE